MASPLSRAFLRLGWRRLALPLLFALGAKGSASLIWGVNGAGGSGTWDDTDLNWYNGTQNVAWVSGGSAIFENTGGTVVADGENVASLAFETPGYTLTGSLVVPTSGLTITTAADASLNANITNVQGANTLVPTITKSGTGALTLSFSSPLRTATLNLNRGDVNLETSAGLLCTMANQAGVTLTCDQTAVDEPFLIGLAGGGASGGVVQPMNAPGTATIYLSPTGSSPFSGVLKDNGSGVLAVIMYLSAGGVTLANANTYSGPTSIQMGQIGLSGGGTILNSAVTIGPSGSLALTNSTTAIANRISSTLPLTMEGGAFSVAGSSSTGVTETVGNLVLASGDSHIALTEPSGIPGSPAPPSSYLVFSGLTRIGHAMLSVANTNITLTGVTNDATGIAPIYIVEATIYGNLDWAVIHSDGSIATLTSYVTDPNTAGPTSHVKINSATATLNGDTNCASVNFQNSSGSSSLDLGTHTLTQTTGGILSSGFSSSLIANGTLTTAASEWVITTENPLTIGANIGETIPGTVLTKGGSGTLTLSGTNTYSGLTSIQEGTLLVSSDANLGLGSTVEFGGGTLQAGASFPSAKNLTATSSATVSINTGAFDVSLSGNIAGNLTKTGTGTLTLTSAPTGEAETDAGVLALPNAAVGEFALRGGTLRTNGTVAALFVYGGGTLDLGGAAPASLTIGSLYPDTRFTIDFGLGTGCSDFLTLSTPFDTTDAQGIQFEFQNLGGLTTGVDYPLVAFPDGFAPPSSLFTLAPDLTADGWVATFTSDANGLSVNFSAIPEPDVTALLATAGAGWMLRRRRGGGRDR